MDRYSHLWLGFVLWLAALLIAVAFNFAIAGTTVRLAWDHDGAEGYRLYMGESGQPLTQVWQGPEKTTALDLVEGKTYQFAVTAYRGNLESAKSDILQYTVPEPQKVIVVPGKPAAIRIEFQ